MSIRPRLVFASACWFLAAAAGAQEILTPPLPPAPRINGPSIFGVRPGSPFLYTIPATGDRPMTFGAEHLPDGLSVDPATRRDLVFSLSNSAPFAQAGDWARWANSWRTTGDIWDRFDVFLKPLEDGSSALGFFNRGSQAASADFDKLAPIGLPGRQHVRDLWRQKDLPDAEGTLSVEVPAHGVLLLRLTPAGS